MVWSLTFSTSVRRRTIPDEMTRPQTVHAEPMGLDGSDHSLVCKSLELDTRIQWVPALTRHTRLSGGEWSVHHERSNGLAGREILPELRAMGTLGAIGNGRLRGLGTQAYEICSEERRNNFGCASATQTWCSGRVLVPLVTSQRVLRVHSPST